MWPGSQRDRRGGRGTSTRQEKRRKRRERMRRDVRTRRGEERGRQEGEEIRRGHGTTLLNVVPSVRALPSSVVKPTLRRALCPVLVGISGAPTGPHQPCLRSSKSGAQRQGNGGVSLTLGALDHPTTLLVDREGSPMGPRIYIGGDGFFPPTPFSSQSPPGLPVRCIVSSSSPSKRRRKPTAPRAHISRSILLLSREHADGIESTGRFARSAERVVFPPLCSPLPPTPPP